MTMNTATSNESARLTIKEVNEHIERLDIENLRKAGFKAAAKRRWNKGLPLSLPHPVPSGGEPPVTRRTPEGKRTVDKKVRAALDSINDYGKFTAGDIAKRLTPVRWGGEDHAIHFLTIGAALDSMDDVKAVSKPKETRAWEKVKTFQPVEEDLDLDVDLPPDVPDPTIMRMEIRHDGVLISFADAARMLSAMNGEAE